MKLTTRSEYGLLALIYLARHTGEDYVSVDTIATARKIPKKFLEQLLLALKRAGYVRSMKGQHGGYLLAKPAGEISIAAVVRLFDGALAPTESVSRYFYESTPIEKEKKLLGLFREIRDSIAERLENVTLADMA